MVIQLSRKWQQHSDYFSRSLTLYNHENLNHATYSSILLWIALCVAHRFQLSIMSLVISLRTSKAAILGIRLKVALAAGSLLGGSIVGELVIYYDSICSSHLQNALMVWAARNPWDYLDHHYNIINPDVHWGEKATTGRTSWRVTQMGNGDANKRQRDSQERWV